MERVGKEGVITVQDGKTLENELEVVEGMKFDRGYISPYFITDAKTQTVELENPLILLVEKKVSSLQQLVPLLESTIKSQSSLLIVAEDVESEALAILAGGTVISTDTGMKLEEVTVEHLGRCKKLTVTKNDTVVLDGGGEKAAIEERCELISHSIENTKSDYEKEKLQERLAKLSGGVAVIKVGGASEVEVTEKKDRVVDALNATRAAVQEGIVPGGGKALLHCSTLLDEVAAAAPNMDQRIGVEIIQRALRAPISTIAKNAGEGGAVIVGELTKKDVPVALGFDAQHGTYVDMFEAGIIDPTKVTRTGLVDAASVAGLLTTSEAMIVDKPAPEGAAGGMPPGMGGGMPPGMGGMGM